MSTFETLEINAGNVQTGDRVQVEGGYYKVRSHRLEWYSRSQRAMITRFKVEGGYSRIFRTDEMITVTRKVA